MQQAQRPRRMAADRQSQSRAHACRVAGERALALVLVLVLVAARPNPAPALPDLPAQRVGRPNPAKAMTSDGALASHGASALPFSVIAARTKSANQGRSAPVPVRAPHRAAAMVDAPGGSGSVRELVWAWGPPAARKHRRVPVHPVQTWLQRRPRPSAPIRQSSAPPPASIGGSSSIRSSSRAFPSDLSRANSPSSAQSCGETAHYGEDTPAPSLPARAACHRR